MSRSDVSGVLPRVPVVARSHAIDGPVDLLDHYVSGGFAWLNGDDGFVATGVAATVEPHRAAAFLDSIAHEPTPDTSPAAGVRAIGALAFAGGGRLIVPARIVGRDAEGRAWCTQIERVEANASRPVAPAPPTRFTVDPLTNHAEWHAMVEHALVLIADGSLEKVVLARAVTVEADRPWDIRTVLATLRTAQSGCIVYGDGGFVGASPELLVRKRGARVSARPLAGTGSDPAALLRSAKDAFEHEVVVDAVTTAIAQRCSAVEVRGPEARTFTNVSHLATTITAAADDPALDVVELVTALHPTPAVGGTPSKVALDLIAHLEPIGRGRYAGPCGWVDARGDGEFVVALRGGELAGSRATLHAGAGIVAGSDPDAEWAETQQKLTPMLQALVRP